MATKTGTAKTGFFSAILEQLPASAQLALAIYMRKLKPGELEALEADIETLLGSLYVRDPGVFIEFVDKYHLRNSTIFIQIATRIGTNPEETEAADAEIENA